MAEHYYTQKQTSEFRPERMPIRVAGIEFEVYTSGGVFSPRRLDPGTQLLIESATVKKGWKILDLGCGYGAAGIAIKKREPSTEIVMSDINERAVELATMNIKLNKIDASVLQSDAFKNPTLNPMKFDTILLNPPQTAGRQACMTLIEQSKRHLLGGGLLQMVARHNKGGRSLSEHMESVFGNVRDTAKKGGYRVYASEKRRR
jgi:16S rRNA (guanine1207-N2)-methyltransferase